MKLRKATTYWSIALATASWAAPVLPGEPTMQPEGIAALSHESYAVREKATHDLWTLGEKVLPDLRKAVEGGDPEAAVRARELIRKIELGILPDSSPKIVALVMAYDRGGLDEKRKVISDLKRERAFRQILKLYALEKNEETLAMLEEAVRGVAVDAARDCLASEPPNIAGAFAYLDMARPEAPELMAKAALHQAHGSLEKELEKAMQLDGEQGHLWRYALLASAGRLPEAAAEAEKAGLEQTSARLQLLAGDPLPWLKVARPSAQVVPAAGLEQYREFAIRSWEGREVPADLTRTLRRHARGGDQEDQAKELRLLFLTGDLGEAEKRLVELDPCAAFYYFESAERVEDALRALGLDPAAPDYKGWALKRFRTLPDEDSEGTEIVELAMLGYFLEHRGLLKELDEVFVGPLLELSKADQEIYISTINRLFRGLFTRPHEPRGTISSVPPVLKSVAQFAGDDELRWGMAVANLFDFLDDADRLWSLTATLDPALDRPARLEWLCRLFGFLPDLQGDRERFLDLAWKAIEREEAAARRPMVELMAALDDTIQNKEHTLRCIDALELEDNVFMLRQKGVAQAALGRWDQAVETWRKVIEMSPADPLDRVRASICLRRAGDAEAADREEKRAELLALGEIQVLHSCGTMCSFFGEFERAARWWQRAAAQCTRNTSYFSEVLDDLIDHAQAAGDWQTIAAYSEAQAFYQASSGNEGYRVQATYSMSAALQTRIDAGLALALSRVDKDKESAMAAIGHWSAMPYSEMAMADHFFAPMREAGLTKLHDKIFETAWIGVTKRIRQFPDCDNSRNSAAWLASRANRRLDEAQAYLEKALERAPRQPAYLDTMAEIHFARGDRSKAVELSSLALKEGLLDFQILRQHQRFENGALPPK
jgi:tetratricopeptide (TPR) repeat protein